MPAINMVYADTSGDIAWIAAGQSPIRRNWDGLTPVPGDGRFEWDGFYTAEGTPAPPQSRGRLLRHRQRDEPARRLAARRDAGRLRVVRRRARDAPRRGLRGNAGAFGRDIAGDADRHRLDAGAACCGAACGAVLAAIRPSRRRSASSAASTASSAPTAPPRRCSRCGGRSTSGRPVRLRDARPEGPRAARARRRRRRPRRAGDARRLVRPEPEKAATRCFSRRSLPPGAIARALMGDDSRDMAVGPASTTATSSIRSPRSAQSPAVSPWMSVRCRSPAATRRR